MMDIPSADSGYYRCRYRVARLIWNVLVPDCFFLAVITKVHVMLALNLTRVAHVGLGKPASNDYHLVSSHYVRTAASV